MHAMNAMPRPGRAKKVSDAIDLGESIPRIPASRVAHGCCRPAKPQFSPFFAVLFASPSFSAPSSSLLHAVNAALRRAKQGNHGEPLPLLPQRRARVPSAGP